MQNTFKKKDCEKKSLCCHSFTCYLPLMQPYAVLCINAAVELPRVKSVEFTVVRQFIRSQFTNRMGLILIFQGKKFTYSCLN